ncbi:MULTISPECIES: AraC family transcriptional regulator [unclassified Aminobacter]|uniref:helix-turn-helix domain-containing protein n=1 Tax=unclassified Aminobacter TaxID=2644704 RepID=UPI000466188E|nr:MULTISPECIES: AraC family transcriptional regulator [unclassified Aminobacter]TWH31323.1 AraC family transcriptional regulator [Aminobacter sp. J15]
MERLLNREFSIAETHSFEKEENFALRKTSAGLGWRLAFMSVQEEAPYKRSFPPSSDVLICIVNCGYLRGSITVNGRKHSLDGGPGSVTIVPDKVAFDVSMESTISSTHFYIRRRLLDEVAQSIFGDDCPAPPIRFTTTFDPVLEQLCNAVRKTLDDPDVSTFYVNFLVKAVAAYLVKNHAGERPEAAPAGKLTERQLRHIREFIDARLGERLALAQVAHEFGLSADHFGRVFKQCSGVTLYQFIIRCRVDRARHLLEETGMPIIEIAQECGFADQVHLTRAFRRIVGTTPAAYRKNCSRS